MRLLLTGATGFTGRALLKLLPEDTQITILGRSKPKELKATWEFVEVDLASRRSVEAASDLIKGDFDALVHLAAHVPKAGAEDTLIDAVTANICATAHLLDAFGARVRRHVLGSTVEVYDQSKISGDIDEDTPVGPMSYYASTKLGSEYIAISFAKKNLLPTIVLRFSVMYGPNDPIARAIPNFIKQAVANEDVVITGGNTLRDYIHVDDVAVSVIKAINSSETGILSIGTGHGVTIEEAAKAIVESAQSSSRIVSDRKKSVDIVINPQDAERRIGFVAKKQFPDSLDEMIESFRF